MTLSPLNDRASFFRCTSLSAVIAYSECIMGESAGSGLVRSSCEAWAMSEPIDELISADWWVLVGALQADLLREIMQAERDAMPRRIASITGGPEGDGYALSVTLVSVTPTRIRITFQPVTDGTRVRIAAPDNRIDWNEKVNFLDTLAAFAFGARRQVAPTADEAIERYYRSQKVGLRKSLRQIAEETGYSYGYLRAVKIVYDKAGKWGSKKNTSGGSDKQIDV